MSWMVREVFHLYGWPWVFMGALYESKDFLFCSHSTECFYDNGVLNTAQSTPCFRLPSYVGFCSLAISCMTQICYGMLKQPCIPRISPAPPVWLILCVNVTRPFVGCSATWGNVRSVRVPLEEIKV